MADALHPFQCDGQRSLVPDVAVEDLGYREVGKRRPRPAVGKCHHLVACVGQSSHDGVADIAVGAGHEYAH